MHLIMHNTKFFFILILGEIGANMQCTSFTPVYYHARDLNVGASGYSWHLYDSNASCGEERGYNVSMPPCDQYSVHDKEVLKQIILNHEATFRYQVFVISPFNFS